MKTTILHPATFKLDGGAMFGIIPKPLWSKKIKADEFNRINMSLRVVLFETDNRKVLVDTGIGDYHPDKFNSQFDIVSEKYPLEKALLSINLKPDDITDIILTHLHFDHVGGLGGGNKGQDVIFKNATIHVHKKHLEYAQNATLRDSGSFHTQTFVPLLNYYERNGQLNLINNEEGEIIDDNGEKICYKTSFGHTPYMIHPYTKDYIYMADLVPMEHHLHIPWVMGYDIEPGVTTLYKKKFYDFIIENKLSMIFEHDNETIGAKLTFDEKLRPKLISKTKSKKEISQGI